MPWQAGQQGSLSSEGRAHQLALPSLGSSREVSGLAPQGVVVSALELAVSRSHMWSAATRSPSFWEALCWGQGQDGRTGSGWPVWLGQERELAWALAPVPTGSSWVTCRSALCALPCHLLSGRGLCKSFAAMSAATHAHVPEA